MKSINELLKYKHLVGDRIDSSEIEPGMVFHYQLEAGTRWLAVIPAINNYVMLCVRASSPVISSIYHASVEPGGDKVIFCGWDKESLTEDVVADAKSSWLYKR